MAISPYTEASIPGTPGYVDNTGLIKAQSKLAAQGPSMPGMVQGSDGNWVVDPNYNPNPPAYDNPSFNTVPQSLTSAVNNASGLTPKTPTGNGQPFAVGDTQAQWIPQMGFYTTDPQMMQLSTQDSAGGGVSAASPYALNGQQTDALVNARNASLQGGGATQNSLKLGGYMYDPKNMPAGAYTPGFTPTAAQVQQYGLTQAGVNPYGPTAQDLQYMPQSAGGQIPNPTPPASSTTGGGTLASLTGMLPFGTFNGINPIMLQQQIAKDQSSVAQQAGANSRDLANHYASGGFSTRGPGFTAQTSLDAARQAMADESIGSTDRLNAMNYNAQGALANNQANYGYWTGAQQAANTRYGIDQNSQLGALGAVLGMLK